MRRNNMQTNYQNQIGPVELTEHYKIFKTVETRLKEHLAGLDHEYYLVGLRVAYDPFDSDKEPDDLPYAIEFGYLAELDAAIKCSEEEELSDEDLLAATSKASIPVDLLDELFAYAKEALEAHANQALKIGVFVTLTGSALRGYSVTCPCNTQTRKKYCYYDTNIKDTRCYCTTRGC
jgi:hypothetical protein